MSELYPLKFHPIPLEKLWGGNNLQRIFSKNFSPDAPVGESWEISSIKENISVVADGHLEGNNLEELIEVYMGDLVGEKVFEKHGGSFPLLIKLIDATDDLSIQVHPDDELAFERHGSMGKTEMWYVLNALPGAELISGFNQEVTPTIFTEKLNDGNLYDILNVEKVRAGDVFFTPAGRVHAIRKGIVLAEIQQTSDITYRIYDWDRTDEKGNKRQLHVDLAIDAIDFSHHDNYKTVVEEELNNPVLLADCEYFTTNFIRLDRQITRDYISIDSFVIYLCTEGGLSIKWANGTVDMKKGETILIPASIEEITLSCEAPASLLEVYIK